MMGGSYGGYMANWIAGHTDRFKAIVTPRRAVGAGPDVRHHGPTRRSGGRSSVTRWPSTRDVREELTAPAHRPDPHAHAGHPRQPGLPGAGRRGAAAVVGPVPARRRGQVPLLPRREPLDPHPGQRADLVRDRASPSSPSTSSARSGNAPASSDPRVRGLAAVPGAVPPYVPGPGRGNHHDGALPWSEPLRCSIVVVERDLPGWEPERDQVHHGHHPARDAGRAPPKEPHPWSIAVVTRRGRRQRPSGRLLAVGWRYGAR